MSNTPTGAELIAMVDESMRRRYHKSLDEMNISTTPGYWEDKEPEEHPHHPMRIHGVVGVPSKFKATYTYFDFPRDGGKFSSPTRTWKIIQSLQNNNREETEP